MKLYNLGDKSFETDFGLLCSKEDLISKEEYSKVCKCHTKTDDI